MAEQMRMAMPPRHSTAYAVPHSQVYCRRLQRQELWTEQELQVGQVSEAGQQGVSYMPGA
jgi:hypothetical protein